MKNFKIFIEKNSNVIIIVLLVLLNIIIKSIFLTYSEVNGDEPATVLRALANFNDLVIMLRYETNQPLFFIIMHFWVKVFGIGAVALRFLPMLFSSLTVIFIYLIGKKYYNYIVAIGASLLYTFSTLNIFHAHDARVYGLFVFLATLSMYLYFSMIDATNKRKYTIALTITNILIAYAHLCGIFLIFLQIIYTLIFSSVRKKIFKEHLLSSIILFIAFLPYVIFIAPTYYEPLNVMLTLVKKPNSIEMLFYLFAFSNNPETYYLFRDILFVAIIVALITWKKITLHDKMILGWFVIPFFLMFVSAIIFHNNVNRFYIYITPGFYLSIIIAANYISRFELKYFTMIKLKYIGILLTLICVFCMIMSCNLKYTYNMKMRETIAFIKKHKSDSTRVYISSEWISMAFAYHYNPDLFKDYRNYNNNFNKDQIFIIGSANDPDTSNFSKTSDVLLVDYNAYHVPLSYNQKMIYNTLQNKFGPIDTLANFNGYIISHFGPKPLVNNNKVK